MNTSTACLLFATIASVTAGCMSSSESAAAREPHVNRNLVLLTADQAERRGLDLRTGKPVEPPPSVEPLDASAVLGGPEVKVYVLNRSIDPADRELMHEEHAVYRRESSPRWRLDAPADQKVLIGPRITDGRQDLQPILSKELAAFLADQRRVAEANQKAIQALFDAVSALNRQQEALARQRADAVSTEAPGQPQAPAAAVERGS